VSILADYLERVAVLIAVMRREPQAKLVDDLIEAYLEWREECVCVRISYDDWTSSIDAEAGSAFSAYRAALEREERACHIYAECLARVAKAR
jgi:hypothetical protein